MSAFRGNIFFPADSLGYGSQSSLPMTPADGSGTTSPSYICVNRNSGPGTFASQGYDVANVHSYNYGISGDNISRINDDFDFDIGINDDGTRTGPFIVVIRGIGNYVQSAGPSLATLQALAIAIKAKVSALTNGICIWTTELDRGSGANGSNGNATGWHLSSGGAISVYGQLILDFNAWLRDPSTYLLAGHLPPIDDALVTQFVTKPGAGSNNCDNATYYFDTVHLTDAGYALLGNHWKDYFDANPTFWAVPTMTIPLLAAPTPLPARCMIGYPIVSDVSPVYTPSIDGGSWSGTLPLVNLQDRRLAKVARSTNAAIASTQFTAHLLRQARVGVIALPNHTISQAGQIRIRGFSSQPFFDSLTAGDGVWANLTTRTAAAFTCSDGVPLDLIADTSASVTQYTTRTITPTTNGIKTVSFRIARNSAYNKQLFQLYDGTASADRLLCYIDFTLPAPNVTCTVGTLVAVTDRGDGSYVVVCQSTSGMLAANSNGIAIYPALNAASDQASFYIGDIQIFEGNLNELQYEGGIRNVWPTVYPAGSLNSSDARDPRLVDFKYTADEAAQINIGFVQLLPADTYAWHWKIEILDPTNTAGYVDIGRLIIADSYQPSINMSQGAKLSLSSATTRTETDGGAAVYNDKPRRREQVFTIDYLTEDEALVNFFDMQRRLGTSGQLYFVHNAADTYHMHRRSFLGTMRELSALEYPFGTRANVPFAVIEEL